MRPHKDAAGEMLVLLETKRRLLTLDTRVCIARKRKDSKGGGGAVGDRKGGGGAVGDRKGGGGQVSGGKVGGGQLSGGKVGGGEVGGGKVRGQKGKGGEGVGLDCENGYKVTETYDLEVATVC